MKKIEALLLTALAAPPEDARKRRRLHAGETAAGAAVERALVLDHRGPLHAARGRGRVECSQSAGSSATLGFRSSEAVQSWDVGRLLRRLGRAGLIAVKLDATAANMGRLGLLAPSFFRSSRHPH